MAATDAEIKQSFYDLAKKYHPDQQAANATEQMMSVNNWLFQSSSCNFEVLNLNLVNSQVLIDFGFLKVQLELW